MSSLATRPTNPVNMQHNTYVHEERFMEIPQARVVTVETVCLPDCLDEDAAEPSQLDSSTGSHCGKITIGRLANEDRRISSESRECETTTDVRVRSSELQSPALALCHDSTSTTPALQEERQQDFQEELSQVLEWFRDTFTRIGKHGRVSLRDFKCAARECEVSEICTIGSKHA